MKYCTKSLVICVVALLLTVWHGHAQLSPNQTGLNAAMLKLFGNTTAFTSKSQVQMLDKADKETMSLPLDFALLEGKIRLDLDLTKIKSKDLTPEMIAPFKQMNMTKMATVVRTDKKQTLVIYPGLQAYAETPMSSEEKADWDSKYKLEKTLLGKDTFDGHPCEKNRVVLIDGKGARQEALVWNATDLKDFPVQIQLKQPDATVVMQFRDLQLVRPEAKQFEAPAGYAKHESIEKLMQAAMAKMLGGK